MSKAYYNEHDKFAAQWLRELINAGHIAPGDVDERSIEDVKPNDLEGYTQCHFFAGIGVWSYALRLAGWPDDSPVWTGSCPCQPFSAAGKGGGFDDERHLWPSWLWLVQQRRPGVIFGEQVEAAIRHGWLDLVQSDLESCGYAFGAFGLPAAGFGAPHIRQRIFFVANAEGGDRQVPILVGRQANQVAESGRGSRTGVALGDTQPTRLEGHGGDVGNGNQPGRHGAHATGSVAEAGAVDNLADAEFERQQQQPGPTGESASVFGGKIKSPERLQPTGGYGTGPCDPCPTNGHWRDADWLYCRDGKWRPVEPGTFPLAHGAPARVGRLRGYGNAIVAEVAKEFIEAYLNREVTEAHPSKE